jgi:hypothetical protein
MGRETQFAVARIREKSAAAIYGGEECGRQSDPRYESYNRTEELGVKDIFLR